jgi:hypothetical protein
LYKLLTSPANYHEGFVAFINGIENVEIKPEWWDELEEEIGHLQSEIAFRREEDVKNCVMSFYINKIKKPEPMPIPGGSEQPGVSPVVPHVPAVAHNQDTIKKAKSLVREQTMPSMMWQKVVIDHIEEHPEVAGFIVSYLGS